MEEEEKGEGKRNEFALNLTVYGSAAPRCLSRPKVSKSSESRKPPKREKKELPFSFPVDKIILLAERLEFSTLREGKVESVSLSAVDFETARCEEAGDRLASRCGGFSRHSPDLKFPLDISSVSEADEGSDVSDDEVEGAQEKKLLHFTKGSSASSNAQVLPSSWNSVGTPCETLANERNASARRRRDRSDDLINLYVSAVDNQEEITKYFRPCHICREAFCVCLVSRPSPRPLSAERSSKNESRSSGNSWPRSREDAKARDSGRITRAVETDGNVTGFGRVCASCPFAAKKCFPEVSKNELFDWRRCRTCIFRESNLFLSREVVPCPRDCFCRFCETEELLDRSDKSGGAPDSTRIPGYASSLAKAAQSARVLARDLELVLSNFKSDRL